LFCSRIRQIPQLFAIREDHLPQQTAYSDFTGLIIVMQWHSIPEVLPEIEVGNGTQLSRISVK